MFHVTNRNVDVEQLQGELNAALQANKNGRVDELLKVLLTATNLDVHGKLRIAADVIAQYGHYVHSDRVFPASDAYVSFLAALATNPSVTSTDIYPHLMLEITTYAQAPDEQISFGVPAININLADKKARHSFLQLIQTLISKTPIDLDRTQRLLSLPYPQGNGTKITLREALIAYDDPEGLTKFMQLLSNFITTALTTRQSSDDVISLFEFAIACHQGQTFFPTIHSLIAGNLEAGQILRENIKQLLDHGLPAEMVWNLCAASQSSAFTALPNAKQNRDTSEVMKLQFSLSCQLDLLTLLTERTELTPLRQLFETPLINLITQLIEVDGFDPKTPLGNALGALIKAYITKLPELPLDERIPFEQLLRTIIQRHPQSISKKTKTDLVLFLIEHNLLSLAETAYVLDSFEKFDRYRIRMAKVTDPKHKDLLAAIDIRSSMLANANDPDIYADYYFNSVLNNLTQLNALTHLDKRLKIHIINRNLAYISEALNFYQKHLPPAFAKEPTVLFFEIVKSLISPEIPLNWIRALLVTLNETTIPGILIPNPIFDLWEKNSRGTYVDLIANLWHAYKDIHPTPGSEICELLVCYSGFVDGRRKGNNFACGNIFQQCISHNDQTKFDILMDVIQDIASQANPTEGDIATIFKALSHLAIEAVDINAWAIPGYIKDTYELAITQEGYGEKINTWIKFVLERNFSDNMLIKDPKNKILDLMHGKFTNLPLYAKNEKEVRNSLRNCCDLLQFSFKQQIITIQEYVNTLFVPMPAASGNNVLEYLVKQGYADAAEIVLQHLTHIRNNPDPSLQTYIDQTLTTLPSTQRLWLRGRLEAYGFFSDSPGSNPIARSMSTRHIDTVLYQGVHRSSSSNSLASLEAPQGGESSSAAAARDNTGGQSRQLGSRRA